MAKLGKFRNTKLDTSNSALGAQFSIAATNHSFELQAYPNGTQTLNPLAQTRELEVLNLVFFHVFALKHAFLEQNTVAKLNTSNFLP